MGTGGEQRDETERLNKLLADQNEDIELLQDQLRNLRERDERDRSILKLEDLVLDMYVDKGYCDMNEACCLISLI